MRGLLLVMLVSACTEPTYGDAVRDWAASICMRAEECNATHLPVGECAINVEIWYCSKTDCTKPYRAPVGFEQCLNTYDATSCDQEPLACVPHAD